MTIKTSDIEVTPTENDCMDYELTVNEEEMLVEVGKDKFTGFITMNNGYSVYFEGTYWLRER